MTRLGERCLSRMIRYLPLVAGLAILFVACLSTTARGQNAYVGTERCRTCHGRLSEAWAGNVHARTLKIKDLPQDLQGCEACHGPGALHARSMEKRRIVNPARLPAPQANIICGKCHLKGSDPRVSDTWAPLDGSSWRRSGHQKKGVSCLACHSGHSAVTRQPTGQLCASCHSDVLGTANQYTHLPVAQRQCSACHDPHGTSRRYGLSRELSKTCQGCHDVTTRASVAAHKGYAVAGSDCTGCHSAHSHDRRARLVKAVKHAPFGRGQCTACHVQGSSSLVKPQSELCSSCHDAARVRKPNETVVHYPVAGGFCTGCHAPHASLEEGLLKDKLAYTCFRCHTKTEDKTLNRFAHRPAEEGACQTCHRPHASNQRDLLARGPVELCGSCHNRHARFTHPLGEKYKDPTGAPMTCATCHGPHGTEFRFLGRADPQRDLCLRCHRVLR